MSVTDEIKSRIDIVSYVQRFVPSLKKAGRNHKACCPFHNEKTPSFVVNPERQTWHCFGACSEGGDLFTFAQKINGWDFKEALQELAQEAGVQLRQQTPQRQTRSDELERLRGLLASAAEMYQKQLLHPGAKAVLGYVRNKRGLTPETIETFQFGYAPDSWHFILQGLGALGHSEDEIIDAGLAARNENGRVYDRFRNRLMIPIRDERGRVADPTSCANWNTVAYIRLAFPSEFTLCLELGEDVNARDGDGNTPLHMAAETVNPRAVRFLLEAGADLNVTNHRGATPLHITVGNEGVQYLSMLHEAGVDISARISRVPTPLHIPEGIDGEEVLTALLDAGADIMTSLLEAGADIDAGAGDYGTPLLHVIAGDRWIPMGAINESAVTALLAAGVDVNASDSDGNTPLLASLSPERRDGPLTDLALRLLALGADPNQRDGRGRTPLYTAAAVGEPAVVRALLGAGADPLAVTDDAASALHAAAASGSVEVINFLIGAGLDPDALTDDSRAPLHLAAQGRRQSAQTENTPWRFGAFALLAAGADPNVRTEEGDTPLHLHASRERVDTALVSGLVRAGAEVNARNDNGETPLHLARAQNIIPAIRKLLRLGADPEARDNTGRIADPDCQWGLRGSPLYGAAFLANSPAESVRGCLASGMPADARDENGSTRLANMVSTLFCCADFENVLGEFVASGADVNARDDDGKTPLHRAIGMSARVSASVLTEVTAALLNANADPNARDSQGSTLLHAAAAERESSPLIHLLAAAGADINARNDVGQTPLHISLRRDDPLTVRTLLRLGANPTVLDSAGKTADPVACERWGSRSFFAHASADIVAGCLGAGADVHAVGGGVSRGMALHHAAAHAPDSAIISILLAAGADVHARAGFYGYTPLHQAAERGTAAVVRALLEAGADPNAWATGFSTNYGWSWTPLHLAAASNPDPEVVAALLKAGADLNALGGDGLHNTPISPLHYAGANPNPAVAQVLLDAGADVNAASPTGSTPLHEAGANASDPGVIEHLVAAGADVNARDVNGNTPLHSAAWSNHRPEVIAALIAAGADLNARDQGGHVPPRRNANHRTPLLTAVIRGGPGRRWVAYNGPVIEALVHAGANLTLTDEAGRTAVHEAARWHPAVFPLLLRLGADPTVRDAAGNTPLDYALEIRSLEGLPEVRRMREALRRR